MKEVMESNGNVHKSHFQTEESENVSDTRDGDSSFERAVDRIESFDHSESVERRNDVVGKGVKIVNGAYHFTLTGYSLVRSIGVGNHIRSGTFTVGGHEWAILFFPNGKYEEDQSKYVSVFITLVSDSYDVQTLFQMSLLDRSGKGKHRTYSLFDAHMESLHTLRNQGSTWGYKRFFLRDALEKSEFLKNDTIELNGRIGVLHSSVKPIKLPSQASPISPLERVRYRNSGEEDSSQDSTLDEVVLESPSIDSRREVSLPRRALLESSSIDSRKDMSLPRRELLESPSIDSRRDVSLPRRELLESPSIDSRRDVALSRRALLESPSIDSRRDALLPHRSEDLQDLQIIEDQLARYYQSVYSAARQPPIFIQEHPNSESVRASPAN